MVTETGTFAAATLLTVIGLAVMLYGVSLNNGTAFNGLMGAGGVIIGVGVASIVVAVMRLEATAEPE